MSLSGRIERLERNLPESGDTQDISDEDAAEAVEVLRAMIAHQGHDSHVAAELRSELGAEVYEPWFGDVVVTGKAPWGPDGVS